MKKATKMFIFIIVSVFISGVICGCSFNNNLTYKLSEKIELKTVVLNEVEFKNADNVSLNQTYDKVVVGGVVDAMTDAEKAVFGVDDVTHVIAVGLTFDKERTLSYFEIKGNNTKVYSTNSEDENYVGNLTDILDNESGEDASSTLTGTFKVSGA